MPEAELKVFLTADPAERARRRAAADWDSTRQTVLAEQTLRDERDSTRADSPLRPARGRDRARHDGPHASSRWWRASIALIPDR